MKINVEIKLLFDNDLKIGDCIEYEKIIYKFLGFEF
jgi:hypothetical protein